MYEDLEQTKLIYSEKYHNNNLFCVCMLIEKGHWELSGVKEIFYILVGVWLDGYICGYSYTGVFICQNSSNFKPEHFIVCRLFLNERKS